MIFENIPSCSLKVLEIGKYAEE